VDHQDIELFQIKISTTPDTSRIEYSHVMGGEPPQCGNVFQKRSRMSTAIVCKQQNRSPPADAPHRVLLIPAGLAA
jgi:hypothetical protein